MKSKKSMFQSIFALILSLAILSGMTVAVYAEAEPQTVDSGTCGENVSWTLYDNGKLVIKTVAGNVCNELIIADNGCGIDEEDLPHIFERFWQADDSHHKKGQGLGLSLAEMIVELHGGSIRVQSELGKGSVFEILLPM